MHNSALDGGQSVSKPDLRDTSPNTNKRGLQKDLLSTPDQDVFKPQQARRGDGIADFLLVKTQFLRCRDEVTDLERRMKTMEELFHKQSIIQSSNEIVTTASLQNYLDALASHIERQFQEKVLVQNEFVQKLLTVQKEEVKLLLKEKAPKQKMDRQLNRINELVINCQMRLDQVFTGLEISIQKNTQNKAELRDLEIIDQNKADINEVKRVEEKVDRLQRMVEEQLERLREEAEEDSGEEVEEDYDDEVDDLIDDGLIGGVMGTNRSPSPNVPQINTIKETDEQNKNSAGSQPSQDSIPKDSPHFKLNLTGDLNQVQHNSPQKRISNSNVLTNINPFSTVESPRFTAAMNKPSDTQGVETILKVDSGLAPQGSGSGTDRDGNTSPLNSAVKQAVEQAPQLQQQNTMRRFNNMIQETLGAGERTINDAQSSVSSKGNLVYFILLTLVSKVSKVSKSKGSRRGSSVLIKNQLTKKADQMLEIEAMKKEIAECNNKITDVAEKVDLKLQPVCDFVNQYQTKLEDLMRSYEYNMNKIKEMESYDDSLKHKYLQATLTQVNEIKKGIMNEQNQFKIRQKQDRESFLTRLKSTEVDLEQTKQGVEYLRKVHQQHKFFGGCFASTQNNTSVASPNVFITGGDSISMGHQTQDGGTQRSTIASNMPGAAVLQQSVMQANTVPHQIVLLNNHVAQLQTEIEELKQFTQKKIAFITLDIDDLRKPMSDAVSDLKKENESFLRELERLDEHYKQVFGDYVEALKDNKALIQKIEQLEYRLTQSNYINNATIQFFGTPGSNTRSYLESISPAPSTPLQNTSSNIGAKVSAFKDAGLLDSKAAAQLAGGPNMWKRRRIETTPAKLEEFSNKVAQAKRKLQKLSQQVEPYDFSHGASPTSKQAENRAKTSIANRSHIGSRLGSNDQKGNEQHGKTQRVKLDIAGHKSTAPSRSKAGSSMNEELESNFLRNQELMPRTPKQILMASPQSPDIESIRHRTDMKSETQSHFYRDTTQTMNTQQRAILSAQQKNENGHQLNTTGKIKSLTKVDTNEGSVDEQHKQDGKIYLKRFKNII